MRELRDVRRGARDRPRRERVGGLRRAAGPCEFDCILLAGRYTLLEQPALTPVCRYASSVACPSSAVGRSIPESSPPARAPPSRRASLQLRRATGRSRRARGAGWKLVCAEFDVPLRAAALQFPLAHPAVASVVAGECANRAPKRVTLRRDRSRHAISASLLARTARSRRSSTRAHRCLHEHPHENGGQPPALLGGSMRGDYGWLTPQVGTHLPGLDLPRGPRTADRASRRRAPPCWCRLRLTVGGNAIPARTRAPAPVYCRSRGLGGLRERRMAAETIAKGSPRILSCPRASSDDPGYSRTPDWMLGDRGSRAPLDGQCSIHGLVVRRAGAAQAPVRIAGRLHRALSGARHGASITAPTTARERRSRRVEAASRRIGARNTHGQQTLGPRHRSGERSAPSLAPAVDHLLECFGPKRMMWGSDWPVCELACSYHEWRATTDSLLVRLSLTEREQILSGNCTGNLWNLSGWPARPRWSPRRHRGSGARARKVLREQEHAYSPPTSMPSRYRRSRVVRRRCSTCAMSAQSRHSRNPSAKWMCCSTAPAPSPRARCSILIRRRGMRRSN